MQQSALHGKISQTHKASAAMRRFQKRSLSSKILMVDDLMTFGSVPLEKKTS